MNAETYIKAQLARLAIEEGARHGGVNNMVAVAFVMKNRVSQGWQGGDWEAVLADAPKRIGTEYDDTPLKIEELRNPDVRQFLQRIDDIFDGSEEDTLTDGAVFYAELHNVTSEWFRANVLKDKQQHRMTGTIGQVSFFT